MGRIRKEFTRTSLHAGTYKYGRTPLHDAAAANQADAARLLIFSGSLALICRGALVCPLPSAASCSTHPPQPARDPLRSAAGAAVDAEDIDGCTPLLACCTPEMAALLLDNGAEVRSRQMFHPHPCASHPCSSRAHRRAPPFHLPRPTSPLPLAAERGAEADRGDAPPRSGFDVEPGAGEASPGQGGGHFRGGQAGADAAGRVQGGDGRGVSAEALAAADAAGAARDCGGAHVAAGPAGALLAALRSAPCALLLAILRGTSAAPR